MSEKPILFSTDMVKAIMDGRKTMTRRVIKPQPERIAPDSKNRLPLAFLADGTKWIKPPYQPGDVLWVRETWAVDDNPACVPQYIYKADDGFYPEGGWRPSIHMPREAARLFLTVKEVRVEGLQDITEEDVKAEGIKSYWAEPHRDDPPFIGAAKEIGADLCQTRHIAFKQLWDSIYAKKGHGWEASPYVWVTSFERKVPK